MIVSRGTQIWPQESQVSQVSILTVKRGRSSYSVKNRFPRFCSVLLYVGGGRLAQDNARFEGGGNVALPPGAGGGVSDLRLSRYPCISSSYVSTVCIYLCRRNTSGKTRGLTKAS